MSFKVKSIRIDELEKEQCDTKDKNNCCCYRYITIEGNVENIKIEIKSLNLYELDLIELAK